MTAQGAFYTAHQKTKAVESGTICIKANNKEALTSCS